VKSYLQELIAEHGVIGSSVAILDNEGISTFSAGKLEQGIPEDITPDSVFEAASLSKPVFAYIVLKMVERGKFDLDTPLYQLSQNGFGPPELREVPEYQLLTARMILSHQSGLPNWAAVPAYQAEPGMQFNYSGLGFQFLCDVVEEVSGLSLEALAKRELEPLGIIQSSYFYQPEDTAPEKQRFAKGHNSRGVADEKSHYVKKSEENPNMLFEKPIPAASLFITAPHYAKFLEACLNDDFVRPLMFHETSDLVGRDQKAIDLGVTPETLGKLHWGLGMGVQTNLDGSKTIFHWGDSETYRNLAAVRVDENNAYKGVVCLSNSVNGPAVFRQMIEPVVGNIEPIVDWLNKRERFSLSISSFAQTDTKHTNIARTQTMRGAVDALKDDQAAADDSTQHKNNR
jgi:CubicO group peptidase (beta-lactamase class C family)